jgi:hypothetical protein
MVTDRKAIQGYFAKPVEYSDDRIAAMTGQRIQTVWEWRHGLRKPRGRRVLKTLEDIKLVEGRWIKQS